MFLRLVRQALLEYEDEERTRQSWRVRIRSLPRLPRANMTGRYRSALLSAPSSEHIAVAASPHVFISTLHDGHVYVYLSYRCQY